VADQSYQLVVRKGPRPGQVFPLTLDTITIGRDPLSDIVINDPEISRHHAKILRTGDGYELQDMGSTNGSFVDGKRMGGDAVSLRPGQVVMLGSNVTLIYQATSASDPMATMIAPSGMPGMEEPEPAAEPEPPMAEPEPEPEPVPEIITAPEMKIEEAMMEPEPEPEPMMHEDIGMATMMEPSYESMEPEPTPMPSFEAPKPMPSYEEPEPLPSFDSGAPLPDFDSQPSYDSAPPPPPMDKTAEKGGMSRNTMIAIVVIIVLCCCCLLIAAGYYAFSNDLFAGLDSTVPLITNPNTF
jgi:predicted component of type VI protein secretion system